MNKIEEIIIGTNNDGKYKEICDLLPNKEINKTFSKKIKHFNTKRNGKKF